MADAGNTMFDYSELTALIDAYCGFGKFANRMGMRPSRLRALLDGRSEFTQAEIIRASALLGIGAERISAVFFCRGVQKM